MELNLEGEILLTETTEVHYYKFKGTSGLNKNNTFLFWCFFCVKWRNLNYHSTLVTKNGSTFLPIAVNTLLLQLPVLANLGWPRQGGPSFVT